MPFAFDGVVRADFAVVGFDEGLEEAFTVLGEDDVGECVVVPVYVLDLLDVELQSEFKRLSIYYSSWAHT